MSKQLRAPRGEALPAPIERPCSSPYVHHDGNASLNTGAFVTCLCINRSRHLECGRAVEFLHEHNATVKVSRARSGLTKRNLQGMTSNAAIYAANVMLIPDKAVR